jgi:hypothetical protein
MTRRVLLGHLPDGHYGLRVSEPGYDVASHPVDDEKLFFSSDWPALLPIHITGYAELNNELLDVSYSNLGFTPHCAALINVNNKGWEQYTCSGTIISNHPRSGQTYDRTTINQVSWEGDIYPLVRVSAFNNKVRLETNTAVKFYYFIYHLKAYDL